MATVRTYQGGVEVRGQPAQRQQAFDQGDGGASGLRDLGQGLGQLAKGVDVYRAKVDEAAVNELDASFGNTVRQVERDFLSAKGKNAVDQADATLSAWNQTAASYLSQAKNPRQAAMLNGVLARRRERWNDQYDRQLMQQTDVWQTEAFESRLGTLAVDVADQPLNSPERMEAMIALGSVLDDEAKRKGWDAETRKAKGQTIFSGIHANTVEAMIESDPEGAKAYFDENRENILPTTRNTLSNKVSEAHLGFVVDREIRGDFVVDADPEVEVEVTGEKQTLRIGQPVSAGVGSRFGPRRSPGGVGSTNHKGVDYPVPANTPVSASLPGVVRVKNDPNGYGTYVVIDHGNGLETRYAHLNRVNVQDGQRVEQGDKIALSGGARGAAGAGNSQGPHLHYEVRRNGQAVNPETVSSVAVASGAVRSRSAPSGPTTEADARDWAERRTEALGGDWRMRQALERAAIAEVNRTRSARADVEGEAMRAVENYLPGGPNEVTDVAAIPRAAWNQLSPGQRRSISNAIDANNKGDEAVDRQASDDLEHQFRDLAAGSQERRQQFLATDLVQHRDEMTREAYNGLVDLQRTLRGAGAPTLKTPDNILEGSAAVVTRYARASGIETGEKATAEDRQRLNLFTRYVQTQMLDFQNRNGRPPNPSDQQGIIALSARQVEVTVNGERERVRAFEAQGPSFLVIPNAARTDILRRLTSAGIRNPTSQQIQTVYNRGIREGLYDVPDAPEAD